MAINAGNWLSLLLLYTLVDIVKLQGCVQPIPLGIESGDINNTQITASSYFEYSFAGIVYNDYPPFEGRLNNIEGFWATLHEPPTISPWIQVKFWTLTVITGIATQGNVPEITTDQDEEYVTDVKIQYGNTVNSLMYVVDANGNQQTFVANTDNSTVVTNTLSSPVVGYYLRVLPVSWVVWCSMRLEVYGCEYTSPQTTDEECYTQTDGADYRGTVSTTATGKTCQKWTSQTPHAHTRTPENHPDVGLGDHNYCRNPDAGNRTWCYTVDPYDRFDYCDVGSPQDSCIVGESSTEISTMYSSSSTTTTLFTTDQSQTTLPTSRKTQTTLQPTKPSKATLTASSQSQTTLLTTDQSQTMSQPNVANTLITEDVMVTTFEKSYASLANEFEQAIVSLGNQTKSESVDVDDLNVLMIWENLNTIFPEESLTGNPAGNSIRKLRKNHFDTFVILESPDDADEVWDVHLSSDNKDYRLLYPAKVFEKDTVLIAAILNMDLPSVKDIKGNQYNVGSRIISLTFFNRNGATVSVLDGSMFNVTLPILPDVDGQPTCQFITSTGFWSTEGCHVSLIGDKYIICTCTHMTSFAVLMRVTDVGEIPSDHAATLTFLTYATLICSIICLVITLVLYAICRLLKTTRIAIHANLAASLLLAQLVTLLSMANGFHRNTCIAVTIFLHYLWLVVFMWMLMEGLQLFLKVNPNIKLRMKLHMCMVVAWGLPLLIVFTALGIGIDEYGHNEMCWLPVAGGLIYSFVGPAVTIILINIVFLVVILRKFLTLKTNQDKTEFERVKASVRAMVILVPILGVTWLFGVFQFDQVSSILFSYLFTLFNGLQGLFIFLTQCLSDDDVMKFLRKKMSRGKVEAWKSDSVTGSTVN